MCRLRISRHRDGLGANVVANPRFNRMRRVQFEDRMHLIRRERGQIGQPFTCQFYDGFDVGFAGDAFIDRAGARADVIS